MQQSELILKETLLVNELLKETFPSNELKLLSAERSQIIYGFYNHTIIFDYSPDQYEKGDMMFLKDLRIKGLQFPHKEYSVFDVFSFLKNNCQLVDNEPDFIKRRERMKILKELISILNNNSYPDWEKKYEEYIKLKYDDDDEY